MKDILKKQLTCSLSGDLLRRDGKDGEHLSHDLHKHLRHFGSQRNLSINPKTLEEVLNALKQLDERIVARAHIFRRLNNVVVKRGPRVAAANIRTARSTPIPVKTAPAGGNACRVASRYASSDYGLDFRDVPY